MIISSYDSDGDDKITYSEFINMLITPKDPILKQLAVKYSKSSIYRDVNYNFNANLPQEIETNLIKFFIKEINLFQNLNNYIKEIRNDYNEISFISNLFSELDFENKNFFREDR